MQLPFHNLKIFQYAFFVLKTSSLNLSFFKLSRAFYCHALNWIIEIEQDKLCMVYVRQHNWQFCKNEKATKFHLQFDAIALFLICMLSLFWA